MDGDCIDLTGEEDVGVSSADTQSVSVLTQPGPSHRDSKPESRTVVRLRTASRICPLPSHQSQPLHREVQVATTARIADITKQRKQLEELDQSFTDEKFPPHVSSIDGRNKRSVSVLSPWIGAVHRHDQKLPNFCCAFKARANSHHQDRAPPRCLYCNKPAVAKKVWKDGPNHGRYFWSCPSRQWKKSETSKNSSQRSQCSKFFKWAEWVPHSHTDTQMKWNRCDPPVYSIVSFNRKQKLAQNRRSSCPDAGFRSADVQQGSVGNCWFLSAVAIVAERQEFVCRIIPEISRVPSTSGM